MGKGGVSGRMVAAAAVAGVAGAGAVALKRLDEQHYIVKDVKLLSKLSLLGLELEYKNRVSHWTVADGIEEVAARLAGKAAIVFEDEVYSFQDWEDKANQSARFFRKLGVQKGDVVAIYMENRPEFIFAWSGLAKLGACSALINNQLKKTALRHCLDVSGATHVLVGAECAGSFDGDTAEELAAAGYQLHVEGAAAEVATASSAIPWAQARSSCFGEFSMAATPKSWRAGRGFADPALLIYTSGTTGLPKAAILKHARLFAGGPAYMTYFGITQDDVIYNSGLPLYHSAATNVGVSLCLVGGCTLVLRSKFSASNFFQDCAKYKCTVAQYIGELCRYLLDTPPGDFDQAHRLRLAVGNGLRPEIWEQFQTRFNIPEIGEFYGSSEGNLPLFNHCKDASSRGSIGHQGTLMQQLGFCTIVKFDHDAEQPVRDSATGYCVRAADGEPGEGIAEIKDRVAGTFDGYYGSEEQTNSKILRDVFRKGDAYFRSGDLLMKNARGFYFFVDRIGDTFRWKAENVSTTEVAGVVGNAPGVKLCAVYGVQVPNKDGRACAAAVVVDPAAFDMDALRAACSAELPSYAQPLFLRIITEMESTGTMKIKTVGLKQQGVDPSAVADPLFFNDAEQGRFVPMDMQVYNRIVTGQSRL